jgi:hypothetical protein
MVNKVLIPGNFRDNQGCSQSKTAAKVTAEAMAQSTAVRGLTGSIPPNGKSGPRWESDNAATVTTNPPPEYWVGWSPSQRESGQTGNRPGSPRRCRQHGPARLVVDPIFPLWRRPKLVSPLALDPLRTNVLVPRPTRSRRPTRAPAHCQSGTVEAPGEQSDHGREACASPNCQALRSTCWPQKAAPTAPAGSGRQPVQRR